VIDRDIQGSQPQQGVDNSG